MSFERLEAELLKLPREVRARLAERLIASLDVDSEIEEAWVREADDRYRGYLNGESETLDAAAVLSALRQVLER